MNLRKIREELDIDFAHFTYKPGMCSCCYGPKELPSMYWKNRKVKTGFSWNVNKPEMNNENSYTYLLFKNADNGSGHVTKNDEIDGYTYIEWGFPMEKLRRACELIQGQLDDDYEVLMPKDCYTCIKIGLKKDNNFDADRYERL